MRNQHGEDCGTEKWEESGSLMHFRAAASTLLCLTPDFCYVRKTNANIFKPYLLSIKFLAAECISN